MKPPFLHISCLFILFSLVIFQSCDSLKSSKWQWETITAKGKPTARHEAGLVAYKDNVLLIGGRRINPTDEFNTKTNTWSAKSPTPIELHHFQPVVIDSAIYLVGAMTGKWPNEKPLERIVIYYPEQDKYVFGDSIPKHRRRGGAGAVTYNNKIYLLGGITKGHMNGYKPWLDVYDPLKGGLLQKGSKEKIKGGSIVALGNPPSAKDNYNQQDWVCLVKRISN